jgi:lipopolysaccharide export LptBFGC system permease protein LptF
MTHARWIVSGNDLIQARLEFTPVMLRDVHVYRMDDLHRLRRAVVADYATPSRDRNSWVFHEGQNWDLPIGSTLANAGTDQKIELPAVATSRFEEKEFGLALDPTWLGVLDISARYLPNAIFNGLAEARFSPDFEYRTWVQARYALSLYAFALLLLGCLLAQTLLTHRIRIGALACIAGAGYFSHTLMKIFIVLGEHGYISPVLAGWAVPTFLVVAGILVLRACRPIEHLVAA